jgi:hypothetical protein
MPHRSSHLSRYPDRDKLFAAMKENGQEKPDLSVFSPWLQQAWAQLRSAFLIGAVIMGGYAAYREAFPQKEAATAADVTTSGDNLRAEFRTIATEIVQTSLLSFNDSLQVVRRNLEDSVARPVFKAILDLDRRMTRVERVVATTNSTLEEQHAEVKATTMELLDRVNDRSTEATVVDAMQRLANQMMDRMDAIERRLPKEKTSRFKAE